MLIGGFLKGVLLHLFLGPNIVAKGPIVWAEATWSCVSNGFGHCRFKGRSDRLVAYLGLRPRYIQVRWDGLISDSFIFAGPPRGSSARPPGVLSQKAFLLARRLLSAVM